MRISSGEMRAVTLSSAAKTAIGFSIFWADAGCHARPNAMAKAIKPMMRRMAGLTSY